MSTKKSSTAPGANQCPVCERSANWLEEERDRIEYGCGNHHTWHVDKYD